MRIPLILTCVLTLASAAPLHAQLGTNLVACYPLDEASGDAIDIVGGLTGVETAGTIASAVGIIGTARDFEADDTEHFQVAHHANLNMGSGDWSISVWVRPEATTNARLFGKTDDASPFTGWSIARVTGTGAMQAQVSDGTSVTVTGAVVAGGAYSHVAVTRTGADILIYVNGTPSATLTGRAGSLDNVQDMLIGAFNATTPTQHWDGRLDELMIWKGRLLSGANVTALYNGGAGLSCATVAADTASGFQNILGIGTGFKFFFGGL
jgi:hypothetical protein